MALSTSVDSFSLRTMEILEIVLLILTYTLLVLVLLLQLVCYKRGLESIETILLTISLILLTISQTVYYFSVFLKDSSLTNTFILLSCTFVGLTTPLNTLQERQHNFSPIYKKALVVIAAGIAIFVITAHSNQPPKMTEYLVYGFLTVSVVGSMLLIRSSKPKVHIAQREKMERIMALAFIAVLPISLFSGYLEAEGLFTAKIGFTLPLIFIILAGNKLWEDIQRLSLFNPQNTIKDQNLSNYQLTNREKEVAELIIKGTTYAQIAEQLFISLPTVKTHVSNIYQKCKVKNKAELISRLTH